MRKSRTGYIVLLTTIIVVVAKRHILLVAPDVVLQAWIIHKGITVSLNSRYSIIAGYLYLIDRIKFRPNHHHVDNPVLQSEIFVRKNRTAAAT